MSCNSSLLCFFLFYSYALLLFSYFLFSNFISYLIFLSFSILQVDEMQHISFEYARKADKDLARKLKNRHDTRAAEIVQKVKSRSMSRLCCAYVLSYHVSSCLVLFMIDTFICLTAHPFIHITSSMIISALTFNSKLLFTITSTP